VAGQPFGEISPARIRAGLVPEEQSQFDESWRVACLAAAEIVALAGMLSTLEIYASHALIVEHGGRDGYRELLARAEERLRTGAEPTGGMSGEEMLALIQERLGGSVYRLTTEEMSSAQIDALPADVLSSSTEAWRINSVSASSKSSGPAEDRRVELRKLLTLAQQPCGEISPRKVRAGLIPEEQSEFDEVWNKECLAAAETQDLTGVVAWLENCGRRAALVFDLGADGYRNLLADAAERLRPGVAPEGSVSSEHVRAMIRERLQKGE
jgi:hypothetical protein